MFPFFTPQCLFDKSFSGHQELSSSPHLKPNPSPDLFPFSPLNFHNDTIHDLIETAPLPTCNIPPPNPSPTKPITTAHPPLSRKRALRKDRHSKIFTAQGPRDRRMRLSLEVARKFFDLQDMLGFDKASKTVLWLLTVSDSAIKDLIAASTPKDHAFSESSTVSDNKGKSSMRGNNKPNTRKARRLAVRASRKEAVHPMLARESRAKARARARERTTEKKKIQGGWLDEMAKPNQLGYSSNRFENDLKPLVTVVEEKSSLTSEQGKKAINDFPMEAGVGLNQIFDYNQNLITNHDVMGLLQEHLEMNLVGDDEERELLAHVQYQMRSNEVFNSNPILG